jgi:predicted HicB family RNase H-like nuclease
MASTASDTVEPVAKIPMYLRVDPELHRRAMVDAARHGISMSDRVAAILDAHLPSAEPPAVG